MQIEEDVIHRDLHNPSHRTTAEFNGFIVHSKYFSVLNTLTSPQTFFKALAYFSARFQDINRCCISQILLKKQIKSIEQYVLRILAFLQVRSSATSSSNSRERHFFSSLLPKQLRFQSNIPSNRLLLTSCWGLEPITKAQKRPNIFNE